jgi:Sugar-transfer associated ATP-grasp
MTQTSTGGRIAQFTNRVNRYRDWASQVQQQTGKSLSLQMKEIAALRSLGGNCGVSDYYWYKLYDRSYHKGRGAPDFLGWALQEKFSMALNPRYAVLPAWDKFVFTQLGSAAGLPVAPIKAAYHPASRISPSLGRHLQTKQEVANFLRNQSNYPLFGKPAFSQQGFGSAYLASYDPATDTVAQLNGAPLSMETFLKRLDQTVDARYHKPECGFLFQEGFGLAPEIKEITQWSALCGVRLMCLNDGGDVHILRSFWKIAVPPNQVDNFSMGRYGNLLADVDPTTGEVSRMLGAFWPNASVIESHPASGRPIAGFRLPGWDKVLEACRIGAATFPLMKIQHWDFALTDKGPMILELNDIASTQAAQIHGNGLLTEVAREFLKRHGNIKTHSWIADL